MNNGIKYDITGILILLPHIPPSIIIIKEENVKKWKKWKYLNHFFFFKVITIKKNKYFEDKYKITLHFYSRFAAEYFDWFKEIWVFRSSSGIQLPRGVLGVSLQWDISMLALQP